MARIEWEQECKSCKGTGIYVGMAEREGAGVVCNTCEGTGCQKRSEVFTPFRRRVIRADVEQVYATSSGIVLAPDMVPGGVPYHEWLNNPEAPFERGKEIRQHVCPSWWSQSIGKGALSWPECIKGGSFNKCPAFSTKELCWKQFDQQAEGVNV